MRYRLPNGISLINSAALCYLMMSLYSRRTGKASKGFNAAMFSAFMRDSIANIFRCIVDGFVGVGFIALLSKSLKIKM